ncbi:unnamed protein product [Echinostoma caproni]|uniref:Protein patched n=1 Tax=Echinostoma caproni TaxID=27848 RepID=A0A183B7S0_9TREM|nr:unnamed protein product [Echinostoma caproni]
MAESGLLEQSGNCNTQHNAIRLHLATVRCDQLDNCPLYATNKKKTPEYLPPRAGTEIQPKFEWAWGFHPRPSFSYSHTDESQLIDQWQRELVTNPDLQISELPGQFSHSVVFTTRSSQDSKLSQNIDVSASHLHTTVLSKLDKDTTQSNSWFLSPTAIFRSIWTRCSSTSTNSKCPSSSSGASGPFSVGRAPFSTGLTAPQNASNSSASSPWRRRVGPGGSVTNSQHSPKSSGYMTSSVIQSVPSQSQQQSQQQQHHHHHSGTRRGQSWFRLSERKWACLLLCLFAIATLLVAFSLQHVLTVQPSPSSTITVEEVRSSTDRLRASSNT